MKYLLVGLLLLFVINLPPVHWLIGKQDCNYSNDSGSFTYTEMNNKGRDFEIAHQKFTEFKKMNQPDTILYRTCQKSCWKFWRYGEYIFQPQWKLPYQNWDSIATRRGPIQNKSGFQDF